MGSSESRVSVDIAGILVTPQATLDYMNRVNVAMHNTAYDVEASTRLSDDFKAKWRRFVLAWNDFYTEHLSWWARQWSSVYDDTEAYENELIGWRALMRKLGETPESPDPDGPAIPKDPLGSTASGVLKVAAGVALIVGTVMVVGNRQR